MMMKRLLLVLLAGASGAWVQSSAGKTGVLVLTPRIKIALFSQKTLDASNMDVDTDHLRRVVPLSGVVTSPAQKLLADAMAMKSAAGHEVHDQLAVHIQARAGSSPFSLSPAQNIAGVPAKYRRAAQFLQLLARSQKRGEGRFRERISAFPPADVARILSFVSSRGVSLFDVNESRKPLVLSKAKLGRDLTRTGSSTFDSFAYAGYIFAVPLAQYSKLSARPLKDGVVIEMASGHRFTWKREGGRLQLRKLEYLQREGD